MSFGLGACGGGGGGGGSGVSELNPVGNFFVEKFIVTSTTDIRNVLSSTSIGLSFYFTLNADGTMSGALQIAASPPTSAPVTGNWTNLGNNNVDISFNVLNQAFTISGTLFQDSSGNVLFEGEQTSGPPIRFGGSQGEMFSISDIAAHQYTKLLANADLVGTWKATRGITLSNLDISQTLNLPQPGTDSTITFNSDGTLSNVNTSLNSPPENHSGTYQVSDDFHLQVNLDQQPATTELFGVKDNVLTVYLYDQNQVIPPGTTPVSATEIVEFTRQ
jgi:hypothetical protein